MERDPLHRTANAPLLPKTFCIAEYYHAADREHRLVVDERQNYRLDPGLRLRLEGRGAILKLAGIQHPSGSVEFSIPETVTSLGAFLNSTSADQHRAWKRRYMFSRIQEFIDDFSRQGIGLRAEPAATRHCLGQNDMSDPILLPAHPLHIQHMDQQAADRLNRDFYTQIQQDIIEVAPSDDRDFPF